MIPTAPTIKGHQVILEPDVLHMAVVKREVFKERRNVAKTTHKIEVVYSYSGKAQISSLFMSRFIHHP